MGSESQLEFISTSQPRPGGKASVQNGFSNIASNPGLPHPDFISQPWRKLGSKIFLHGCEIKSGQGSEASNNNWCSMHTHIFDRCIGLVTLFSLLELNCWSFFLSFIDCGEGRGRSGTVTWQSCAVYSF